MSQALRGYKELRPLPEAQPRLFSYLLAAAGGLLSIEINRLPERIRSSIWRNSTPL
jgi:hypothetical protein